MTKPGNIHTRVQHDVESCSVVRINIKRVRLSYTSLFELCFPLSKFCDGGRDIYTISETYNSATQHFPLASIVEVLTKLQQIGGTNATLPAPCPTTQTTPSTAIVVVVRVPIVIVVIVIIAVTVVVFLIVLTTTAFQLRFPLKN